jgi:hypothetical protein
MGVLLYIIYLFHWINDAVVARTTCLMTLRSSSSVTICVYDVRDKNSAIHMHDYSDR